MVSIIIILLGNFHNCYYFHTVRGVLHCWEIVEDRKACFATVHGVAKSQTQLSDWITTAINLKCSWHFGISISFVNLRNLFTGTPDNSTWDNWTHMFKSAETSLILFYIHRSPYREPSLKKCQGTYCKL